jgi:DNA-directed RNA polymerase specialized sigma24 family protein
MNGAFQHVDSPVSVKKKWSLTQEALDRLLVILDADRELAGKKYERIRLKLVKYFEWRGVVFPDNEADETINRVARKIEEGASIQNLDAYFYGVARMIFSESLKKVKREQEALRQTTEMEPLATDEDLDAAQRRACLDRCLEHLTEENRSLIIEYYQEEKGRKIERRKALAVRLDIPLNALRIRAHRIRAGLEACVRTCLEQHA